MLGRFVFRILFPTFERCLSQTQHCLPIKSPLSPSAYYSAPFRLKILISVLVVLTVKGTIHEVSNLFWMLITSASSQWPQSCVIYTNAIPCKWAKQNSSENDVWHFTCDLLTSVFCLHEYHMETMVYFILFSIRTAIGKHFTTLLPLKIISSLLVILSWVSLSTAK